MATLARRNGFKLGVRDTQRVTHTFVYILVLIWLVVALLPLAWMISTSLKTLEQLRVTMPVQWIPNPITLANYAKGWAAKPWLTYTRNSLFLAVSTGVPIIVSCSLAAYAFARMRFRGRELLFIVNLCLMLLPGQVTLVPRFVMMAKLGWIGTWLPALVPHLMAINPAVIFVLRQFFKAIPADLSDAARIDGCGEIGIFWRIVLPLSKAIIALQALGVIAWAWNDLLFSLLYLKKPAMQTITLAMQSFIGIRGDVSWGPMMAMSVAVSLPMMILSYYAQRYFTETFTLSGIRG
jgi:multiple sugar transport system permease protein